MGSERDTVAAGVVGKLDWLRTSVREHPEVPPIRRGPGSGIFHGGRRPTPPVPMRISTSCSGAVTHPLICTARPRACWMTTTNPRFDAAVRAITALWMPWQGKRFDNQAATGDNRLTRSTGLVGKTAVAAVLDARPRRRQAGLRLQDLCRCG